MAGNANFWKHTREKFKMLLILAGQKQMFLLVGPKRHYNQQNQQWEEKDPKKKEQHELVVENWYSRSIVEI